MDVLLTLVKCCPTVCESNHFAVLLGAYGATMNIAGKYVCSETVFLCSMFLEPLII